MAPMKAREVHKMAHSAASFLNENAGPGGEELYQVNRIFEMHHEFIIIFIPLIITYLVVMRYCFRSWSLTSAVRKYKQGEHFEDGNIRGFPLVCQKLGGRLP